MTNRATVTFHTSPEVKARLDILAIRTRRSKSFLTNEAVERYLAEEEDFIRDVEVGLPKRTLASSSIMRMQLPIFAHLAQTSLCQCRPLGAYEVPLDEEGALGAGQYPLPHRGGQPASC